MKLTKTIVAVLSVTLTLLATSAVIAPAVHWSGLPKVDAIYFKAYPGGTEDVIVDEFLYCATEWIEGPYRSDLHQAVIDAGHNVSPFNNVSGFTFFPINCRDYKETSGNPNAPLNDSSWRLALSNVYGMDDKQTDIDNHCQDLSWIKALGNPVPPAQEPWYDPTIQMPNTDNATAWNILASAGYSVNIYGDAGMWLHKDGVPVRPPNGPNGGVIRFLYPTGREVYPQGPSGGLVRNWNAFIQGYLGAEGPLMEIGPTDYTAILLDLQVIRDYDIVGFELDDLGRYVDWLWSALHSSNNVPWGSNFCGIHDSDFDRWTEIIMTSMDPTQIQEACENLTSKFVYEVMPWFPVIEGVEYCTTKHGVASELTNLISMDLYGPRNSYSWMCLHWNGTPKAAPFSPGVWPGDAYVAALRDEPDTLNPWTDCSKYGWEIMERSILTGETGLLGISPSTLSNTPFVATKWTVDNWTSIPELGIKEGSMATFWLRQDVLWHDHECQHNDGVDVYWFDPNPVDAYDCVANMRFLREEQPGRYSSVWAHLVYEEADGPFKFNVYFDQTSLYHASHVSDAALLVPEHIIEAVGANWTTWAPCHGGDSECTYDDLMVNCTSEPCPTSYQWMKQLIGCGPFVFRYYDRSLAQGASFEFNEFFVSAPVIGSVVGEWRIDPSDDYPYEVLIHNIGAKTWDNYGHLTNAIVDVAIYEDGALYLVENDTNLEPWEYKYLPGSTYNWSSVPCGPHTITVVITGDQFRHTYEHMFVATIREDISTYCGNRIDFTVDMRDVGRVARAFGSYPGHLRWDPCCDVNDDFKVDMRDIGRVAKVFGWHC